MARSMVECDFDCLKCPHDDCIRNGEAIVKAQPKKGRKTRPRSKGNSLAYCYNANFKPIDYTEGLRTARMAKEDLEAMLQRQFGRKLEPIRTVKASQGGGRARKPDANTVVFFPTQKAPME